MLVEEKKEQKIRLFHVLTINMSYFVNNLYKNILGGLGWFEKFLVTQIYAK